jgi:hypothetical protein
MDMGYKKDENGNFTTIATSATLQFSETSTISDDLSTFIFDPGATKVLLSHFGDGLVSKCSNDLQRLLCIRTDEDPR